MRTTVRLDDALMRRAKRYAAAHGTTLTRLFESAVREKLQRESASSEVRKRPPLPTFAGSGLQPGVDLHDTAAMLDLMDRENS